MSTDNHELKLLAQIVAASSSTEVERQFDLATAMGSQRQDLVDIAVQQGLGPLLLNRLSGAGLDGDEFGVLRNERTQAAVHALLALQEERAIQKVLDGCGVPTIWLKGIVLANTVYASPELRPMVDIDVMVPYDQREMALEAVRGLGYALESPQLFDGTEGQKHHYFLERSGSPVQLELHFRLVGYLDRILTVEQHQWFWQHRCSVKLRSGAFLHTIAQEAHLLYLCAHAILQHGERDMRLIRFYDIDRLVADKPELDWNTIVEGAIQLRWTYATERALQLTSEYFGTNVPATVFDDLRSRRPSDEDVRHAVRRAQYRSLSQVVLDDLAAMTWADRFHASRQIFAPPPRYMRWRYQVASNWALPIAYVRRWRHMAGDALMTLNRKRAE